MQQLILTHKPRWPLYKKLRRTVERDLVQAGKLTDDASIDRYLDENLPAVAAELAELFVLDKGNRTTDADSRS